MSKILRLNAGLLFKLTVFYFYRISNVTFLSDLCRVSALNPTRGLFFETSLYYLENHF